MIRGRVHVRSCTAESREARGPWTHRRWRRGRASARPARRACRAAGPAGRIFTGVHGDAKATDKSTAQNNPLWKNLTAVKAGHAYDVPDETWYLGLGVTAAEEVLTDLESLLTK